MRWGIPNGVKRNNENSRVMLNVTQTTKGNTTVAAPAHGRSGSDGSQHPS